ncbi:MAG: peptide chain release factor 2, peptide chain release factor 2 [Candidatus Parcubacteria bacterium]
MNEKEQIQQQIDTLEAEMGNPDFWTNKDRAQAKIKELQELKEKLSGVGKYDKGDAVMTIIAGAGGTDAEDFAAMLLRMYVKYFEKNNFSFYNLHENTNDHGGYRNITIEIHGKHVYGTLKNESGVHRLVRTSPFNSKGLRHTSFAMVEVIPKFEKTDASLVELKPEELQIETAKSGGPGGQNVNKRETAVRVVHLPTKIAVHVDGERSQAQNKEKALDMIRAKLFVRMEEERKAKEAGMYISKTTEIEWGNQIRSYVLHPYKMVKDHRTDIETSDVEGVLEGELDAFIDAEKGL